MENWKQIIDYPDYLISDLGNVKSIKNGRIIFLKKRKVNIITKRSLPYLRIMLYKLGRPKNFLIHRLVGIHFVSGYNENLQINHIDGNPLNNNYSNLEWCTTSENVKHSFKTNLNRDTSHCAGLLAKGRRYGEDHPLSKLTHKTANEIRRKYIPKIYPLNKLAKEYNVSKKLILLTIQNKIWKNENTN